jgi:hypothetical protein
MSVDDWPRGWGDRSPPRRLTLVGVEAQDFDVGAPMAEQAQDCLDDAVRAVVDALPASARESPSRSQ